MTYLLLNTYKLIKNYFFYIFKNKIEINFIKCYKWGCSLNAIE